MSIGRDVMIGGLLFGDEQRDVSNSGTFQGRDFGHDVAFPRLGRGLAVVKCMVQAS
jgi:hypothetical protein